MGQIRDNLMNVFDKIKESRYINKESLVVI